MFGFGPGTGIPGMHRPPQINYMKEYIYILKEDFEFTQLHLPLEKILRSVTKFYYLKPHLMNCIL